MVSPARSNPYGEDDPAPAFGLSRLPPDASDECVRLHARRSARDSPPSYLTNPSNDNHAPASSTSQRSPDTPEEQVSQLPFIQSALAASDTHPTTQPNEYEFKLLADILDEPLGRLNQGREPRDENLASLPMALPLHEVRTPASS